MGWHQKDYQQKYQARQQPERKWHQESEKPRSGKAERHQHSGYGYGGKGDGGEGRYGKYGAPEAQTESAPTQQNMHGIRNITLSEDTWLTEAGCGIQQQYLSMRKVPWRCM